LNGLINNKILLFDKNKQKCNLEGIIEEQLEEGMDDSSFIFEKAKEITDKRCKSQEKGS
jgi:hypothetical protein